jgi:hypothetical protein
MNWFKENPFLSGLIAVAILAGGAMGFMVFQSWTAYTAASDAYTEAVTKLHGLQNKVPFPSEANLKTIQSGLDDYAARVARLRAQLAKMEVPLDATVTPQQFQDGLRAAVNDIRERAAANNVKLPENFYFGFDQYQTQVPSDTAAPYLNRELGVIKTLVGHLVDLKVSSVNSLRRSPLPQESGSAPAGGAGKDKQAPPDRVFEKFPFEISFTAEQSKFRVAFNSLLGSNQFLLVRSLNLQNSSQQAPSKAAPDGSPSAVANPFASGQAGSADQKNLQVIFGRETVNATLRIEILDFTEPPANKG